MIFSFSRLKHFLFFSPPTLPTGLAAYSTAKWSNTVSPTQCAQCVSRLVSDVCRDGQKHWDGLGSALDSLPTQAVSQELIRGLL